MSDWTIGLSTGCFYRTNIFDVLGPIRKSGFSLLEICSAREHLDYHDTETVKRAASAVEDKGLEVFSFHAPFGPHIDISAMDDGHRQSSLDEMLSAVQAAGLMGACCFLLHPGPEESRRPPPQEYLHRLSHAAESLRRVAQACREQEMTPVFENMLPHLLFGRMPDLFRLLAAVEQLDPGLCLDTGHAYLGDSLYTIIPKMAPRLRMLHVADNHGEADDHLPPGKGDIDWPRVLADLTRISFSGALILEMSGHGAGDAQERLRDAQEARAFLQNLNEKKDGCNS